MRQKNLISKEQNLQAELDQLEYVLSLLRFYHKTHQDAWPKMVQGICPRLWRLVCHMANESGLNLSMETQALNLSETQAIIQSIKNKQQILHHRAGTTQSHSASCSSDIQKTIVSCMAMTLGSLALVFTPTVIGVGVFLTLYTTTIAYLYSNLKPTNAPAWPHLFHDKGGEVSSSPGLGSRVSSAMLS